MTTSAWRAAQSSASRTRRVPIPHHPLPAAAAWLAAAAPPPPPPPLSPRAPPPAASRPQVLAKVTSVSTEGFTVEMLFFQLPSSPVPREYLFDDPDWERLEIGEMSERQRLKCVLLPAAIPTLRALHAHTRTHTHTDASAGTCSTSSSALPSLSTSSWRRPTSTASCRVTSEHLPRRLPLRCHL